MARMKQIIFVMITMRLLYGGSTLAQRGSAPDGYYPPSYGNETFTGKVASVDEGTQTISLVYDKGSKTENFTGSFQKPCDVPTKNGQPMRVSDIPLGTGLTAYYMSSTRKGVGQNQTQNSIFAITFNSFRDRIIPDKDKKIYYCPQGQYVQYRVH
jgi:hypothetical protein